MRANCWYGTNHLEVEDVPDPAILNQRDAIVRITSIAICGSDLHLYDGFIPTMKRGDVLGHEFMGEVVGVGSAVSNLAPADRVVVPFTISCGHCAQCERGMYSLCENSNPNAWMAEKLWGLLAVRDLRLLAHAWRLRGRAGGVRARAVCGSRPYKGFPMTSATSRFSSRRTSCRRVIGRRRTATSSLGTSSPSGVVETGRPNVLREAILACRSGGTISVAGVYGCFIDKFPIGAVVNRSLTITSGQTHVQRYMRPLLERIQKGDIDPTFIITHRLSLDDAPRAYDMFRDKQDECMKVVLHP